MPDSTEGEIMIGGRARPDQWNITNKPKNLTMQNFRALTDKFGSVAKSARYTVRIFQPIVVGASYNPSFRMPREISESLTYLCEATEFPGRAFNTIDVRHYGPTYKIPTLSSYEDITMTFICRNASMERRFFDDWMENINPSNTYDFNYRDQYSTIIELFQHTDYDGGDGNSDVTYQFTLKDAYPIMVNPQPVTWADDNIQKLTVTFTYSKWSRANRDHMVNDSLVSTQKRYIDWDVPVDKTWQGNGVNGL